MADTIFALSSGSPPAAIGIIRISGRSARRALACLLGGKHPPAPRHVSFRTLRDAGGEVLDRAVVLWLPGPGSATGEDLAELHCHGGRAVIAAVEQALAAMQDLRRAEPGEFTRRAFANGRIDLAEAEGLADLLEAETELQRASAVAMAGGALSRRAEQWRESVLHLSAAVEAVLDFADEDDVAVLPGDFAARITALHSDLAAWLARPRMDILREGFRVVLSGPPNSGKSTLFNALVGSEAAIVSEIKGTTRDVLSRPVALDGVPFLFLDTAGLRDQSSDPIEEIGMARALQAASEADAVLWLGPEGTGPQGSWEIEAQIDRLDHAAKSAPVCRVSAMSGEGMDALRQLLVQAARRAMPRPGEAALNARQHRALAAAADALERSGRHSDPLLVAEELRLARAAFDGLVGRSTTEHMLDALFGRFCIGK
jgi:tRNA modification GTPase